jgi:hypothetical protein
MQKVSLARYGHQSLLQWDDVEVVQIRRWFWKLQELLKAEGPMAGVMGG